MHEFAEEMRQRTFRFTVRVITFCRTLPDTWIAREIGRQLLRAGMGVSGNYWSACRGRSSAEFIAKLAVAADEAEENVPWLTALVQAGVREDRETKELIQEGRELRAILAKSVKTARENRRQGSKRAKRPITNSPTDQLAHSNEGLP